MGGDIDLAIDAPNLTEDEFRRQKIKFLTNLARRDFEYKIDVVSYNTDDPLLNNEIRKHSVRLN